MHASVRWAELEELRQTLAQPRGHIVEIRRHDVVSELVPEVSQRLGLPPAFRKGDDEEARVLFKAGRARAGHLRTRLCEVALEGPSGMEEQDLRAAGGRGEAEERAYLLHRPVGLALHGAAGLRREAAVEDDVATGGGASESRLSAPRKQCRPCTQDEEGRTSFPPARASQSSIGQCVIPLPRRTTRTVLTMM